MNLRQIDFFLAVAETGSFTAGAERLRVSQQAMSAGIRKIEEDLGVRLFERRRDGVSLTEYGVLFQDHARGAKAEMIRFRQELAARLGVFSGRLNIGAGPSTMEPLLAGAVVALKRHSPKLMINVYAETYRTMLPRLLRGELDLFVGVLTEETVDPMIAAEPLMPIVYEVMAKPTHPLAGRAQNLTREELESADWILGLGLDTAWRQFLANTGVDEQSILGHCIQTTSLSFLTKILPIADFLTFLPSILCTPTIQAGELVTIKVQGPPILQPLAICYRRNSTRSAMVMKSISLVKDAAAAGL